MLFVNNMYIVVIAVFEYAITLLRIFVYFFFEHAPERIPTCTEITERVVDKSLANAGT